MNKIKSIPESYVESGEFYEILSEDEWALRSDAIENQLKSIPLSSDPIIDIGAGTGRGIELINKVLPGADIIAIEPNAVMRVGLMSRIMANKGLIDKVNIIPDFLQNYTLPSKLSSVFMFGMLGFFDERSRIKLWDDLSSKLNKDGLIFIDTMMISKPMNVPLKRIANKKIGLFDYEIWMKGDVVDENLERWTITYLVKDEDKEIRNFNLSYGWYTFGLDKIEKESKEFGFKFKKLSETTLPTGVLYF